MTQYFKWALATLLDYFRALFPHLYLATPTAPTPPPAIYAARATKRPVAVVAVPSQPATMAAQMVVDEAVAAGPAVVVAAPMAADTAEAKPADRMATGDQPPASDSDRENRTPAPPGAAAAPSTGAKPTEQSALARYPAAFLGTAPIRPLADGHCRTDVHLPAPVFFICLVVFGLLQS